MGSEMCIRDRSWKDDEKKKEAGGCARGKTGTAEYSMSDGEKTHSWFMGFTNVDNPDLVISVITEGSDGSSSGKAVAIAGDILDAYYN